MRRFAWLVVFAAIAGANQSRADWVLRSRIEYPGASIPQLTDRVVPTIERSLRTITGVRSIKTVLQPECVIVDSTIIGDGSDRRTVRLDFVNTLENLKEDMPKGVTKIRVKDICERTYPIVCAVSGRGTPMFELMLRARKLQDALLSIDAVADAKMVGNEQDVVVLSVSKDEFLLNCSMPDLVSMLSGQLDLESAGSIPVGMRLLRICPTRNIRSADDILDLPYTVNPASPEREVTVMLRDHVKVSHERLYRFNDTMAGVNGERCVLVAVEMRSPSEGRDEVMAAIDRMKAEVPLGVEVDVVHDITGGDTSRTLFFDMRRREGTHLMAMDLRSREFASEVRKLPGVEKVITLAGNSELCLVPGQAMRVSADNISLMVVNISQAATRSEVIDSVVSAAIADRGDCLVTPRLVKSQGGVFVRVEQSATAENPDRLYEFAEKLVSSTRLQEGVEIAFCDWGTPVECLRYDLFESRARQLCVTHQQISKGCKAFLRGFEVSSCWYEGEQIPVILRVDSKATSAPQDLLTMWSFSDALRRCVPFSQLVKAFNSVSDPGCRIRRNGRYVARVISYGRDTAAIEPLKATWERLLKENEQSGIKPVEFRVYQ